MQDPKTCVTLNEARSTVDVAAKRADVVVSCSLPASEIHVIKHVLESRYAGDLAQTWAHGKGLVDPSFASGLPRLVPLNAAGVPLYEVKGDNGENLEPTDPRMTPAKYDAVYRLQGRIL